MKTKELIRLYELELKEKANASALKIKESAVSTLLSGFKKNKGNLMNQILNSILSK